MTAEFLEIKTRLVSCEDGRSLVLKDQKENSIHRSKNGRNWAQEENDIKLQCEQTSCVFFQRDINFFKAKAELQYG